MPEGFCGSRMEFLVKEETNGIGDEGGENNRHCHPCPGEYAFQRRQAGVMMTG